MCNEKKMFSSSIICVALLLSFIEAKLVPDSTLNLNEVAYHDEPSQIYLGSPSIVRLSSGRLVASHDFFGAGYSLKPRNVSIYVSDDNAQSWSFLSYIKNSYWTTLAVYNDMIYAIGTDKDDDGNVIVHRSSDNGTTWLYNGKDDGVILFAGKFATGATPIVIANGVMYRAVEYWPSPSRWPTDFQAAVISCDVSKWMATDHQGDDPVMNSNHWRITPPLPFNQSWIPKSYPILAAPGVLEGNIVILPGASSQGNIRVLNVLRFNSVPLVNLAIILELNQTSNILSFRSIIPFPGGMTKFTIRYDPVSQTYLSFVNPVTSSIDPSQRNILSLSYTKDLINLSDWHTLTDRLLYDDTGFNVDDSLRYTGFQYVDWQFDRFSLSSNQSSCIEWNCDGGPHLIYLIRTSYRGANSYHNSNRITFKTLDNYRRLVRNHQVKLNRKLR